MNLASYSIHNTIFISFFLFFIIPISNAQQNVNYGYGVETDFYIVMIIPLTVNIFSFLGTLFIFYRKYF